MMNNVDEKGVELRFFAPDEMLLYVEYAASMTRDDVISNLMQHPALQNLEGASLANPLETSQITPLPLPQAPDEGQRGVQPQVPGRVSSLVTLRMDGVRSIDADDRLTELILTVDRQVQEPSHRGAGEEPVEVKASTVNWLVTSTPETIGVGGPGSIPAPTLNGAPVKGAERFRIDGASIDDIISRNQEEPCLGEDAHVYILDTAHSWETFEKIYDAYVRTSRHPLLQALMPQRGEGAAEEFRYGPGFEVWKSTLLDSVDVLDFQTPYHPYDPSDHGLFVAGIVRTVAPNAPITLVEVLNGRAVGTLQSILDGFTRVAKALPSGQRPVVINCSFMLATPEPIYCAHRPEIAANREFRKWSAWIAANPDQVELPKQVFNQMTSLFRSQGASLVAAAGNEGANDTHPPARFPAASVAAVGVGAVRAAGTSTPYSNEADSPVVDGFQAIGGMRCDERFPADDIQRFLANNDPTKGELGILGIFTRPFPNLATDEEIDNTHGWGYWAGTSFAAPIVAGLLARLRGCGTAHQDSVEFLRSLSPSEGQAKAGAIKVSQG